MKLAICGAGGFGTEVYSLALEINKKNHRWDEYIFIDKNPANSQSSGQSVMTSEQFFKTSELNKTEFIIAIGETEIRKKVYEELKCIGCKMATLIHPETFIADSVLIEEGVIISYGAYISSNAQIKANVVLQPHCQLGHNVVIGCHSFAAGGTIIGGGSKVSENVHLGLACAVREMTSIGTYAIVSMGSMVMHDVPDHMLVMGNPARIIAENKKKRVFAGGDSHE